MRFAVPVPSTANMPASPQETAATAAAVGICAASISTVAGKTHFGTVSKAADGGTAIGVGEIVHEIMTARTGTIAIGAVAKTTGATTTGGMTRVHTMIDTATSPVTARPDFT